MKILISDDEEGIQKTTSIALASMGHQSASAYNGKETLSKLKEDRFDALFLDLRLGNDDGLEVFDQIRAVGHTLPVIVFTAHSSIETAIQATRKGVFDYIPKPFIPEQIRQTLAKIESRKSLESKVQDLSSQLKEKNPSLSFESQEPVMQQVYGIAAKAARSDATILLLGPSGTGKSVLARFIHDHSQRASDPFVLVHCPSLSKELLESELFGHVKGAFTGAIKDTWGKVEAADGGTLFLDEIGDLPPAIQAKLLRLLQERCYERIGETKTRYADVRIIAATNKDLRAEAASGTFREDLYFRLNVISIEMPALSERRADVEPIARRFLAFHAEKLGRPEMGIDDDAMEAIRNYDWPGNLRELNNIVERCVILSSGRSIRLVDLPESVRNAQRAPGLVKNPVLGGTYTLQELEDAHIRATLAHASSLESAASILGIDKATLYRKRKRLGLA